MRLGDVYVNSLGCYLPEPVDARSAVEAGLYDEELRMESGFEATLVSPEVSALDMAVAAGADAIGRGSVDARAIDYLVHGGAYYQGPAGWASTGYITRRLGLTGVASVEVHQECNGMMAALEVAIGALSGFAGREVALLTTATNYSTPVVDRWRGLGPQTVLGDGGAAMLVTTRHGFAEVASLNSMTLSDAEAWHRGAESLMPPRDGSGWRLDMAQRAIDHAGATGSSIQEWTDSMARDIRALAESSLRDAKIEATEIARAIGFHTARYAVEESAIALLGIPVGRTNWECGRDVGHLGPGDHIVSLDRLLRTGKLDAGDHVLLVSWGAGGSATTAVLRILHVPDWVKST